MSDTILSVKNLRFRYRDRQGATLHGISLSARKGELLLIAGASGCGKTTLIRSLNGLIPRSYKGELEGQILINGQDISTLTLAKISQMVGTVLQDPERQILGTRVLNEIAFGLENMGLPRDEIFSRVDEALNILHISRLRDRETFLLSGGEKQKVALAGVLAMRPSVLLLDEPLASLDPASAAETLDIARQLVDDGLTVLMVEHRVEDVLRIRPDRILYMKEGAIAYLGNLDGLMKVVDYAEIKLPAELIIERERLAARKPQPPKISAVEGKKDATAAPLVQFQDVAFGYDGDVEVLKGIALNIQKGDVIAVLGPNGAGKTTFVKHAIGLLKPKRGKVFVNGRDTRELSVAEIANTLGYVFQSPSHMLFAPTVHDELAFGPKNLKHKPEDIENQVRESLATVNLSDKEKDAPLSLSFGQQKRVSIAAILAMRSKILVMDEPTAGQDYKNYMNFMDSILQMPGFEAILFITHDVDLAAIYANRVILVADGRVQADGKPEEVLADKDLLRRCRVIPSSLLEANLARLEQSRGFMRAEELAHVIDHA